MISRQIPACQNCPYRPIDIQLSKTSKINGKKLNIADIDLVIEVGKRIEAIAELKKYRDASWYDKFLMPAHEYVLLKKVAKCLHVDPYFIVFDGAEYYIAHVDRFEKRDSITGYSKKMIPFSRSEFRRMTESELQTFFLERYG